MKFFIGSLVVLLVLALIGVVYVFTAWLFMIVWNFVAAYFGLPLITFWIAVAIMFLLSFVGRFFKTTIIKDE